MFKINIRSDTAGQWLENSIRFSVGEANASRAGGEAVLAKLSEALFLEILCRYIARLPAEPPAGWPARAILKWERSLLSCTATPRIRGVWQVSPVKRECRARCWLNTSASISTSRP